MRKKGVGYLFMILFLLLIGIMDYPFVIRMINERKQERAVAAYDGTVESAKSAQMEEIRQKAEDYNRALAARGNIHIRQPFYDRGQEQPFGTEKDSEEEYEKLLNFTGDGMMGSVEIPKIRVSLPIYHGMSEEILQEGAGHLEGTSLPIGGENTHACILAHRGLPDKKMFTNLDLLEEGDLFYIRVLDETLVYEVDGIETVTPDDTAPLAITAGEDRVTLITCTPYGINSHRLYVHGKRAAAEETAQAAAGREKLTVKSFLALYGWIVLTALLLVWMFFLLVLFFKKDRKRGRRRTSSAKSG